MNAPQAAAVKFELSAPITITMPPLNAGELWVGVVTTPEGLHHVILLPGDQDDAPWAKQMAWAQSIGGDLPTRLEYGLLHTMLEDEFKRDWYWCSEQYAGNSAYAWCQSFSDGIQDYILKSDSTTRARAVRRLVIR